MFFSFINTSYDATIFICRVIKYFKNALLLCIEQIKENYNKLKNIIYIENSDKSSFEEIFNKFKYYNNLAHSICQQSNNNRTLWLLLFEYIYSLFQETKKLNKNKYIEEISLYLYTENEIENVIKNSLLN